MSRRNLYFLVIVIVILVVFIVFAPSYGPLLRTWMSGGVSIGAAAATTEMLEAQNDTLGAQLAELQVVASELPEAPTSTIRAMVYSRYPFNFRNELTVNAGARDGVARGQAVTFEGTFVGVIAQVFPDSATVQTVFDTNLRMAVRIGNSGVDGLLKGGAYPEAMSISKSATVTPGDIVYTAAPGMPYGVPVGTVGSVGISPDNLFQQATVSFVYDINNIETVLVEK